MRRIKIKVEEDRFFKLCVHPCMDGGFRKPSRAQLLSRLVEQARRDGYRPITIQIYLRWIERYGTGLHRRLPGLELSEEAKRLTRRDVERFARRYARKRGFNELATLKNARAALRRWARTLAEGGIDVPAWEATPTDPFDVLLSRYRTFRRRWRGVSDSSLAQDVARVRLFLRWLYRRRKSLASLVPATIDDYLLDRSRTLAPATIRAIATSLRSFLSFLHFDGQLPTDLSVCVARVPTRRFPQPGRVLPWSDIRRVLRVIDRSTEMGKRDYAAILLMPTYGMGSGEVLALRMDDIDWAGGGIRVVRPKTGVSTTLPLLGPVGRALAVYLRASVARRRQTKALFLQCRAPCRPLLYTGLRLRLLHYSRIAGVPFLGTHAFRRSHASRQIEDGVPAKILSDILAHDDPSSLSTYVRITTERLRDVSLPLPR
jgi:integrase/recombinase XerD